MAYQPNFNDPRVQSRIDQALIFIIKYATDQQTWFSCHELDKHLGNTRRGLGKYLKQQLLIVADPYYNPITGVCKKYVRNNTGIQFLKQAIGLQTVTLTAEQQEELNTGCFVYEEKSNRCYNSIQYIPKQYRGSILANHGYQYQYDIEAAAPTLLIQRAQRIDPNLVLVHLEYYTNNRSQVRKQIATNCDISQQQVKGIVNAILQGGALSTWHACKTFQILNYNKQSMQLVQADPLIQQLQSDIRAMWSILKTIFPKKYETCSTGLVRTKRLSARDKSGLYRELELEVSVVIKRLLKKQKIRHLWIHDGWCCDRIIDPADVTTQVRRATGYSLRIDYNIYKDMDPY